MGLLKKKSQRRKNPSKNVLVGKKKKFTEKKKFVPLRCRGASADVEARQYERRNAGRATE